MKLPLPTVPHHLRDTEPSKNGALSHQQTCTIFIHFFFIEIVNLWKILACLNLMN